MGSINIHSRAAARCRSPKALLFAAVFVILSVFSNGAVFDLKSVSSGLFAPDMTAAKQGILSARINGEPVKIESYTTGKSADEIMRYYADDAQKHGYELINGKELARLGAFLINMGMAESPDNWYYLCYKLPGGDMSIITAGEFGRNTRIVTAKAGKTNGVHSKPGFDDRIRHYPGLEKVLSIEILSGNNVIGFANFYKNEGADMYSMKAYYEDYLPKNKWTIQRQYTAADTDMFLIEKKGRGYMLNIYPSDNNEKWVMVMGQR
jgi:hypothetical protein